MASTAIAKWGNSIGVRIPKSVAEQAGLHEGDVLTIEPDGRGFIARLVSDKPTLESLIARITPENRHDEIDWGPPRGHEVW